jgi:hypothetical protein
MKGARHAPVQQNVIPAGIGINAIFTKRPFLDSGFRRNDG